jgi:hypothetical protein
VLGKLGIAPHRALEEDLQATDTAMSYGGGGEKKKTMVTSTTIANPSPEVARVFEPGANPVNPPAPTMTGAPATVSSGAAASGTTGIADGEWRRLTDDEIARLSPAEKIDYNLKRWSRILD